MTSEDIYHYVYRITNVVSCKHYYGKRTSKVHPKKDLGVKYFSSSSDDSFLKEQQMYPKRFRYKIIHIFNSEREAFLFECRLHKRFDVANNPIFYNIVSSSALYHCGFNPSDKVVARDKEGKRFYISRKDPRLVSGEFVVFNKGFVVVKDKHGIQFHVRIDDPRYLSGELKHINCGRNGHKNQREAASKSSKNTVPVVDLEGKKYRIQRGDPRYGKELKHPATKWVLYRDKEKTFWKPRDFIPDRSWEIVYKVR